MNTRFVFALVVSMPFVIMGCVKTVEEDYTQFHNNHFSPREQPAEVFTGDTNELLQSDYLLIGYIDFTHNALSCYEDYTCSDDEKSHMTMDFLRNRSAFRGADQIQVIDSELKLKPAEKSVCTATSVSASFVNGVLVTTTICSSYANYDGYTESWKKRALLWRHEPDLSTAELNYSAVKKALPKLAAVDASKSNEKNVPNPFAGLFKKRIDTSTNFDIYADQLLVAIQAGNIDFLKKQLGSEALEEFELQNKVSLLVLAYQMQSPLVYRWLIEQDVNLDSVHTKYDVLQYAIVFSSPEDVSKLLELHPYLNEHWERRDSIYFALASAKDPKMLDLVLSQGFSPDGVVQERYSLLKLAIDADNSSMVRALIEKGVDVKPLNNAIQSPLTTAIRNSKSELIGLMLDNGASLDDTDSKGNSAIHNAAAFSSPEVLHLLLERGADINQANESGSSPVYLAILGQNWKTAEVVMQLDIDYKAPESKLFFNAIRLLLYRAPSSSLALFLDKTNLLRISTLQELVEDMAVGCAKFCTEESMTVMLDKGINVDYRFGDTSLFSYAYAEKNEATMIALIKHGYREYDENASSLTSLQYALIDGDVLKVRAYRLSGDNSGATGNGDSTH